MPTSSHSSAISPGSPVKDTQPQLPASQQAPTAASTAVSPHLVHPGTLSVSITQTSTPASSSISPTSSSAAATPPPTKLRPKAKAPNVFTNDGSFLDRIRRSRKVKKKIAERNRKYEQGWYIKLQFADRFKARGKRHMSPKASKPGGHSTSDVTPESEGDPSPKRRRLSTSDRSQSSGNSSGSGRVTAQEEYRNAMESYPTSLKDGGTGAVK
ncbi:hypothetical protein D9619_012684 [Psilocybe cf. subviscida]|uniref:Uncharacterized protein n=1 Tax=Psilocybe cf. subviscida TaxID=2480587 RepID=A0A8H5EZ59_9AGAR|nr:hypothetical protein D9619_012684 [Psilocybe cf. subviscida]